MAGGFELSVHDVRALRRAGGSLRPTRSPTGCGRSGRAAWRAPTSAVPSRTAPGAEYVRVVHGVLAGALGELDAVVKAVNAFATTCQKQFSVAVTTMSVMDKAGNDIWIAGKVLPEVAAPSGAVGDLGMKPNLSVG